MNELLEVIKDSMMFKEKLDKLSTLSINGLSDHSLIKGAMRFIVFETKDLETFAPAFASISIVTLRVETHLQHLLPS